MNFQEHSISILLSCKINEVTDNKEQERDIDIIEFNNIINENFKMIQSLNLTKETSENILSLLLNYSDN